MNIVFAFTRIVALCLCMLQLSSITVLAEETVEQRRELLKSSPRIVFLGDSITAGGGYVAAFDAWVTAQRFEHPPTIINLGLPSETISGLSEDGHAGGAFPRPDLAERLDRVLKLTKPNLVFACYGINCGIYQPLDEERFARYQSGAKTLKAAVEKQGGQIIFITPPYYDALKQPKQAFYNGVLDRYSAWLVEQGQHDKWQVIDLHTAMTKEVEKRRQADPNFTFAPDGVHPNDAGQWFMAQQLIAWFGDERAAKTESPKAMLQTAEVSVDVWPLVQRRMGVLRDAHVATAGHKRPGVGKGLPLEEAQKQAAELSQQIQTLLKK